MAIKLHTDLDIGGKNIKYVLAGEGAGTIFVINEKTGDIHAMKRLDREEKAEYTLTAQVVNRDTNEPMEPPSEFTIKVQDINDNAPEFVGGPFHATVPEMSQVERSILKQFTAVGVSGGFRTPETESIPGPGGVKLTAALVSLDLTSSTGTGPSGRLQGDYRWTLLRVFPPHRHLAPQDQG
ncbi:hypothetical protein SKAU_G00257270 [Synaphobranchus kaupii]|uniref:Cadherin domain-containing protein n=1 Tax=Synaphobranchus kaupii TaxID=118154 RepID=A0A9Q1F4E4_SYNKA|nr:hypothetical protein SKAU_G00257270 [Synaphobranchus kaupii]